MKEPDNKDVTEDVEVAEALRSLRRVEAPMGFEAGVRSRVAEGQGVPQRPWALRPVIGLPAAAAVAIGIFVALRGDSVDPAEMARIVPPVVEQSSQASPPSGGVPSATSTVSNVEQATPKVQEPVDYQVIERGAQAAQVVEGPTMPSSDRSPRVLPTMTAVEFFNRIGATVSAGGQGLKVSTVVSGSAAERAGLRAGDVLLAVDGIRLSDNIPLPAGFRGTAVQVSRPGDDRPLLIQIR